jgi:L-fucono-1,5-lactonase
MPPARAGNQSLSSVSADFCFWSIPCAKLSGLDAGQADRWSAADLSRYVDHALTVFGPERLMFGSDWPVSILRGGYGKVWREVNAVTSQSAPQDRARIFGGTAIEVYRLAL